MVCVWLLMVVIWCVVVVGIAFYFLVGSFGRMWVFADSGWFFFAPMISKVWVHMIWPPLFRDLFFGRWVKSHQNKKIFLIIPPHLNHGRSYAEGRHFGTSGVHNVVAISYCHCHPHRPLTAINTTGISTHIVASDVLAYGVDTPKYQISLSKLPKSTMVEQWSVLSISAGAEQRP